MCTECNISFVPQNNVDQSHLPEDEQIDKEYLKWRQKEEIPGPYVVRII